MTDMLQSQRTEKDGFPLPGADDAPWKGQNAQASLSVNLFAFGPKKEEELPVGVVAHTVYVAQTTGNVDGLRDRRISNLPYQVCCVPDCALKRMQPLTCISRLSSMSGGLHQRMSRS